MLKTFIFDLDGVIRKLKDVELNSLLPKDLFNKYHDRYNGMSLNKYLKMCYKQNPAHRLHNLGYYREDEYLNNSRLLNGEPLELFKYVYCKKGEFGYDELIPCSIDLVVWLRAKGYSVYALSNMPLNLASKLRAQLEPYFDDIVFSCDCHLLKPDRQIYTFALSKWNKKIEDCIFIDDSASNLPPFEELGGQTYLFDTEQAERCTRELKMLAEKSL